MIYYLEALTFALILMTLTACGHPERFGCIPVSDGFSCVDGSHVNLPPGQVGPAGPSGNNGTNGNDGQDAAPCTVVDTESGAVILCPDGSSVEVFDGEDGEDGSSVVIVCHQHKKKRTCVKHGE